MTRDGDKPFALTIHGSDRSDQSRKLNFDVNARGLGIDGGQFRQVDDGESISFSFSHSVIVESVSIVAGNGVCGGYYQVGDSSPLAIYCVDADIDSKDQSGILSDIGVVGVGQKLTLSSRRHYGVESPGQWRIAGIRVRPLP